MKKCLRWTGRALLGLLAAVLLGVGVLWGSHRICLWNEARRYPPPGAMVEVNGHSMHVYTQGEGTKTLVFLSGSGTACPYLDFKELYGQLSDTFQIAVVERAGYGYSAPTRTPRGVDAVLDETRAALRLAGVEGPYVLFPHSLAGIEALRWAQTAPQEVEAIVGLDAAVPDVYLQLGEEALRRNLGTLRQMHWFSLLGLYRVTPGFFDNEPALKKNILSPHEKEVYRAVVLRSFMSTDMINEGKAAYANAERVAAQPLPQLPVLYFISNGEEVGIEGWQATVTRTLSQLPDAQIELLDCGHYVHDEQADVIARESLRFLSALN